MRLTFGMRTANRAPKRNYLRATLLDFQRAGGDVAAVHLAVTDPRVDWLTHELRDLPAPVLQVPPARRGANENGLAALEAALATDAEMVVILEDDLVFCADFVGSLSRWLDAHARPDRNVYRCFGFTTPPKKGVHAYDWPLEGLRASQAIILWADEARDFCAWGRAHLKTWVPLSPWGRKFPQVTDPTVAFDKFVATWALLRWPKVPGVMSAPYFVDHVGAESSLHRTGFMDSRQFAGKSWQYGSAVSA